MRRVGETSCQENSPQGVVRVKVAKRAASEATWFRVPKVWGYSWSPVAAPLGIAGRGKSWNFERHLPVLGRPRRSSTRRRTGGLRFRVSAARAADLADLGDPGDLEAIAVSAAGQRLWTPGSLPGPAVYLPSAV